MPVTRHNCMTVLISGNTFTSFGKDMSRISKHLAEICLLYRLSKNHRGSLGTLCVPEVHAANACHCLSIKFIRCTTEKQANISGKSKSRHHLPRRKLPFPKNQNQ